MDHGFLAYLTVTTILVVTPGATTAVVVRNTMAGGRRAGLGVALGAAIANASHAVAAGLGVTMAIGRWPAALEAVRLAGAAYLAWLGLQSLGRAAGLLAGGLPFLQADGTVHPIDRRASLREGLGVNLLNPAVITFYLVVVPAFIPRGAHGYFAVLAAVHVGLALLCHAAWATALHHLRAWLGPPRVRRTLEGLMGIALVALAWRVLATG
jgi:threonine/homoserine/homoserine lactone efflux protein